LIGCPFLLEVHLPKVRLAEPDWTRYTLADGEDWVEFRNCLSWGQRMRLAADTSIIEDGTARTDWGIYQSLRLLAYLRAWSFVDMDGRSSLPIGVDTIGGLDDATGDELVTLLSKHLEAMAPLKNAPTSTPA
jgi:hypothetical protein